MAGPYRLENRGNDINIDTWLAQGTKLGVKSLDPHNYGAVKVTAGLAAPEQVGTTGGGTTMIERNWRGVRINVVNARDDMNVPVEVWTE